MSGKRGKEAAVVSRTAEIETHIESYAANRASDAFRQFFETQFNPLKLLSETVAQSAASTANENEDEDSGSEWDGFPDREEEEEILQVEVIEHNKTAPNKPDDGPDKVARKAFMVSSIDTLPLENHSNAEVHATVDCETAAVCFRGFVRKKFFYTCQKKRS
jgi:hypothetical protein